MNSLPRKRLLWVTQLNSVFPLVALFLTFGSLPGWTQVQHHIAAANIVVVQNDASNNTASVTVTTSLSINDFRIRTGSNRADYNVQIGAVSTDDVANGILMGSINQNGRDNGEGEPFLGMNYGTCAIDSNTSGSPGSSGEYWLPVFQAPNNSEYNFNVAAAWFPYNDGWYGGWLNNATGSNGGANNHLLGHPSLVLGNHVVDQGSGKTKVDLRAFGLDSRTNAILLVEGGKNEANFALSTTNGDGTWTITCHDDNGGVEQDYVGFVCIPLTNHTVVSGRFMGNGSIAMQSQPFQAVNSGNGTYHLSIPGINPGNGVLIISAESGGSINGDNLVSYQMNGDGWDIQTRDITSGFTPALQNLDLSNAVVSFVYIPGPTPGATALKWSGGSSTNWDFSTNQNWRLMSNNALTNYADSCQTILDDSGSNFTVNLTAAVAPYQLVVSNVVNNYQIRGTGSIIGTGGLTKQGNGKLTLAITNQYTGDTIISQGTLALNANGAIPAGVGYGDTVVNGVLDLAGFNCVLNNLSGNGTVDDVTGGGSPRLTINETGDTIFSGTLKNTSGALALILNGGSMLTLAGNNTFSGGCTVSNGTLKVNGALNGGSVSVQFGGGLAGTGVINGSVTMAGNSSLRLNANLPLSTGPITLNGAVAVNISGVSMTNAATYLVLNHGAVSGSGSFNLVLPPGLQANGFTASLADTGTQLQLVVTPAGITGTIADVRHVVLLMVENRAFDHYFGTLHGVRGFNDRNALQLAPGTNIFYQSTGTGFELPFHNSIQCLTDLNHTWPVTHATVNNGKNDGWVPNKGAETMCYFDRTDLPFYYSLADSFTICDEYHCSVLASTDPNRFVYMTGTVDPHGYNGGPEIDNSFIPAGFRWKTYPEFLQEAGVSWKVYSVTGDNSENVIKNFAAFKSATPGTPLYDRGLVGSSSLTAMINKFAQDVASNNLPAVTWLVGTGDHSEHPPESSASGQYMLRQFLTALAANPEVYKSTVFIYNYDENDGFFDHVMPILPPPGTPDEFVGSLPIGLGIRVPAFLISPWSRGGRVCSQVFDHTSVIRFLETWTGVMDTNISAWRRQVCGDLTSGFDFAHPNTNFPALPTVAEINCGTGITPSVPLVQTVPTQEAGTLIPLPLPYQPNASCTLNTAANTFTITMTNTGAASVHFAIYAEALRTDGPWQFDVPLTNSASMSFSTAATAGNYDFSCRGPNGFQRRFAGNLTADAQRIEATSVLDPVTGGIKIELANASSSPVTFVVTNGYSLSSASYNISAHATNVVNVGSETNNGFYDIKVTASSDSAFVRGFLGRVESYVPPTISGSRLLVNGRFQFSFNGPAAQPYHILATTNLSNPVSWVTVSSGIFEGQPVVFTETNPYGQSARFYHLVSP